MTYFDDIVTYRRALKIRAFMAHLFTIECPFPGGCHAWVVYDLRNGRRFAWGFTRSFDQRPLQERDIERAVAWKFGA